ncbi:MAG: sugar phosphate isomerase/epimerase [Deltaproteobacteria bacterium]|nr:sugar phosphate isomerase/epimerase [Deltaproteobacteria bacterium]
MLKNNLRVLCPSTLAPTNFPELVDIAAASGFGGLSLWYNGYEDARKQGMSDEEIKALASEKNLQIPMIEAVTQWLTGDAEAAKAEMDRLFTAGQAIGATSACTVFLGPVIPKMEETVERFGQACDHAARFGISLALEFLPWSGIPDLATAWEIVKTADRPNGGILLDSWHWYRSGPNEELLRSIPGNKIVCIQLNDASEQAEENAMLDTMNNRLLLGDGDIDLKTLVTILDEIGFQGPVAMEVFNKELKEKPPAEAAKLLGESLRSLLEA